MPDDMPPPPEVPPLPPDVPPPPPECVMESLRGVPSTVMPSVLPCSSAAPPCYARSSRHYKADTALPRCPRNSISQQLQP